MKLADLLAMLQNVRNGTARCPAHRDTNNSLSVNQGDKGIVIKCFAGCTPDQICAALGIQLRDLFPPPPTGGRLPVVATVAGRGASKPRAPITLAEFAEAKKLPIDWLKEQGLIDHPDGGVIIGYFDAQGEQAPRQRLRTALRAGDGSSWTGPHEMKLIPFGLWRGSHEDTKARL